MFQQAEQDEAVLLLDEEQFDSIFICSTNEVLYQGLKKECAVKPGPKLQSIGFTAAL